MKSLRGNNLGERKQRTWRIVLAVLATVVSAVAVFSAQTMQRGISVELAPTSSAVPVPEADKQDALIVSVTDTGALYLGIDSVTPDSLAAQLKDRLSRRTQGVYIKADARAPYASVVKVLDAARTAGVSAVTLLTNQPVAAQAGTAVPPQGIEMEMARRSPAATK
jgi:biopolymer transport protein ExbD